MKYGASRLPFKALWFAAIISLGSCGAPSHDASTSLQTPRHYGHAVADWQIAALDDLSYLPTFRDDSEYGRGWIKASFYIGLDRFARAVNDEALYAELETMARENGFDLGRQAWHADDQAIADVYGRVALRMGKPKQLRHVLAEFDAILDNPVSHDLQFEQGAISEGGCQRRWCWADALFMGPPAWSQMSHVTGDARYQDYAARETRATIEYLFDPDTHLFFRDSRYFEKRTQNGKPVFWSRGNGWVFAGLARFIETLPQGHPDRAYFLGVFSQMASALIATQREDGYFPTSLHDPDLFTNPETSGTGLIGFGLAWGLNNNVLSGEGFETATDKAWAAMTDAVKPDGKLGWVQQVGKDPKATTEDSSQIYGAGAFLLMASEMIGLQE
ncbi:MAG: glycoside hydrolase family 88 protein [Robiginitomaculum sp.]